MIDQSGKSVADLLGDLEFYQDQLATYRWRVRDRDAEIERLRAENEALRGRYEYVRDHCLDGSMMLHRATAEQRDQVIDDLRSEVE